MRGWYLHGRQRVGDVNGLPDQPRVCREKHGAQQLYVSCGLHGRRGGGRGLRGVQGGHVQEHHRDGDVHGLPDELRVC